ncbi:DUF3054 domain-containing protein [Corynebacterium diphtheriae]|uniref:DUF3054 domain-containing protein n=1 Tax=Corynebacterium diphtheriae TaxID=1717 RepID=UPI000A1F28E7|nr:DUF3054 domain-containing protein [Corynebacterium diphtheriae]OSQ21570.1 hypothetical protein B1A51_09150 [Corynebacterium diphtheriae]
MKYLAIDVLAVLIFAILARAAHGGLEIAHILDTWWPFTIGTILGWIIQREKQPLTFTHGAVIWVSTAATGLIFWGLRHGAIPHWSFVIVATVMSGILLLGWRGLLALFFHYRNKPNKF